MASQKHGFGLGRGSTRGPRLIAWPLAVTLVAAGPLSPYVTHAQTSRAAITRAEYDNCQARTEAEFRAAIETLTQRALTKAAEQTDYKTLVAAEWRRAGFDDAIDRQVDRSVGQVRDESSWTDLLSSLASRDKAQELATTVADRVYRSDEIKKAIEDLATGVGKAMGRTIETAIVDTAEPAVQCIQSFLGPRYGRTLAAVVGRDAGREYALDPARGGAQISAGQVLTDTSGGIAGAVVLVVRRQLANMAGRIGQRLVGAVASRLVSVVAGGVGVVLIAKDIWDFRHGVLPIVASEMKSPSTKEKVQEELRKTIAEQIGDNLRDISARTADRVLEIWQEFRRAHAKVLELAETHEPFRRFVDTLKVENLPRLDEVVSLILPGEGEKGVLARLDDGTLMEAVTRLPAPAFDIGRETRSLATAMQWSAISGDRIQQVYDWELHRRAEPKTLTRQSLDRVLDIGDKTAAVRLAALTPPVRAALFELETAELKGLARALTEAELGALARYLTNLDRTTSSRILRAVAQTPSRMQMLSRAAVMDGVLASRDQGAAVDMVLRSDTVPDPFLALEHTRLIIDGRVDPRLLWEKHPVVVIGGAFATLVVLVMLKRLLFGRRRARA
jgi:hypothetical protein